MELRVLSRVMSTRKNLVNEHEVRRWLQLGHENSDIRFGELNPVMNQPKILFVHCQNHHHPSVSPRGTIV